MLEDSSLAVTFEFANFTREKWNDDKIKIDSTNKQTKLNRLFFNVTVCIRDFTLKLCKRSEMINFGSLLITFEASNILWDCHCHGISKSLKSNLQTKLVYKSPIHMAGFVNEKNFHLASLLFTGIRFIYSI